MGHGKTNLYKNKVIDNILYVPGMTKNLLLIGKFPDEGFFTLFDPRKCWIFVKKKPLQVLFTGTRKQGNNLYRLSSLIRRRNYIFSSPNSENPVDATSIDPAKLWYMRTTHLNY
jgi:hypothetical protein